MEEKEFFNKIIEAHISSVLVEEKSVRKGGDVEALHRMRVGLRRLKTFLADFRETLPRRQFAESFEGVKTLLDAMGQARDMDTKLNFLDHMLTLPESRPYEQGIRDIKDEIREDREEVQPKLGKNLTRAKNKRLFKDIIKLSPSLSEADITLDEWARQRMSDRLEKMLRLEPYVDKPKRRDELHRIRIAAKNLRYTLEQFALIYGDALEQYSSAATEIQRVTGDVHNFDVWLDLLLILKDSEDRDKHFRDALRFLRKYCEGRREEAHARFVVTWDGFKKKKTWLGLYKFSVGY